MHVRMTVLEGTPDGIDAAASRVESDLLPVLREQSGFRGFTAMADRSSGRIIGMSYWDSEEDMERSADAVRPSRQRAADASGATSTPTVEQYEVLLDVQT